MKPVLAFIVFILTCQTSFADTESLSKARADFKAASKRFDEHLKTREAFRKSLDDEVWKRSAERKRRLEADLRAAESKIRSKYRPSTSKYRPSTSGHVKDHVKANPFYQPKAQPQSK